MDSKDIVVRRLSSLADLQHFQCQGSQVWSVNSNGSLPCVSVDGLIFEMMLSEKVSPRILGFYMAKGV